MTIWSWIIVAVFAVVGLLVFLGWLGTKYSGDIIRSEVNRRQDAARSRGCRNCGWREGEPMTPKPVAS